MTSMRICLQWTIIIYNTFMMILGSLAVIGGAFEFKKCLDSTADCPVKIAQLIIAGILIIAAFVGCCGSINGSIKMLAAFAGILVLLIITHGWILSRYSEDNQRVLVKSMVEEVWLRELVQKDEMKELQTKYECCGIYNSSDYRYQPELPNSCFRPHTILNNDPYTRGCLSSVEKSYLKFYAYEFWTNIGLICFEFLGVILTIVLVLKLMSKTRRYHY